jgi:hypothetical protein
MIMFCFVIIPEIFWMPVVYLLRGEKSNSWIDNLLLSQKFVFKNKLNKWTLKKNHRGYRKENGIKLVSDYHLPPVLAFIGKYAEQHEIK